MYHTTGFTKTEITELCARIEAPISAVVALHFYATA